MSRFRGDTDMDPSRPTLAGRLLTRILLGILSLRYRVTVTGLDAVRRKGRHRILFLPNHPALGDPVLILALLYRHFAPRSLADEYQINRPIVRPLARWLGARTLPNLERRGVEAVDGTRRALEDTIEGVSGGENLLLYPAGHIKRRRLEEVGAASGVKAVLDRVPDVRVVLVRTNGVWGSSLSWGFTGRYPQLGLVLRRGLKYLLLNGLFFMPRRAVTVEFVEPADFPRTSDRMALNRYVEAFFNHDASPNTYVPYTFWEKGGVRVMPEPEVGRAAGDPEAIPPAIRQQVLDHLTELTGQPVTALGSQLAHDLGLDSLAIAELVVWIQKEFGFSVGTPESLQTVGDVVLAAGGKGISALEADLKPPSPRWFAPSRSMAPARFAEGDTITEVFLRQAARHPGRVLLADQISGEKTNRDLILGILVLKPLIEELPGTHVGIMLPASVGSATIYLACLFAGKIPVMVNWTTGPRNVEHALNVLGVQKVITARALLARLESLGLGLDQLGERLLPVEDLRGRVTTGAKLGALLRSYVSWRGLRRTQPPETAVVLFTSGSESLPKAVPLTHRNILTNVRDVLAVIPVRDGDSLLGMLPPFHSFGIVVVTVLPLCTGIRTVYHPNPTEANILARLIESFKLTMTAGTPTFLAGIVRAARPGQLDSLRLAVTGAEQCPSTVYDALRQRCPRLTVLEGYGITECSPVVSVNPEDSPVAGSIGRLLRSVEGAIVSLDSGASVPPGRTGMLLVRGPTVFSGYLAHTGESPFVEFEGKTWYRTGDLVRQTEDGVLFFEGRLKRFVKLGGEMISLPAIEAALQPHFPVSDRDEGPPMAVDALGEGESQEIVLFTTRRVERADVNRWLRGAGLGPLCHVRRVVSVERIPVLGTGKTDYRTLKASFS
jgi:acyl-CoA synthetase (AMP-forming)/AMP-acid ligase II/1-acyl-sn-glycerol-3-phosphate acyltransferase/acyl carrier protein